MPGCLTVKKKWWNGRKSLGTLIQNTYVSFVDANDVDSILFDRKDGATGSWQNKHPVTRKEVSYLDLHKSYLFGFYSRQIFENLLGRLSLIPQQSHLTHRAIGSQKSPEPLKNCQTFLTFVADLSKNMISSGIYFQGLIRKFCVGKRFCQKHYNFNITIQCTNVIFV